MSMIALILGIVAFLIFGLALFPCLGWINWINIPFALVSTVVSVIALATSSKDGKPSGAAIGGLVLSVIAMLAGGVRLLLGGGVL